MPYGYYLPVKYVRFRVLVLKYVLVIFDREQIYTKLLSKMFRLS